MHRDQRAQSARASKRRGGTRTRTDGAPRLIKPGDPGNPYPKHYAIAYVERLDGKQPRSRVFTTRQSEESGARDALIRFKTKLSQPPAERDITARKVCEAYIAAKEDEAHSHGSLKSALQPIIAAWGPLIPGEITQTNITLYVSERSKAPKRRGVRGGGVVEVPGTLSRKTIKNELMMFKVACNWAVEHGWAMKVPPIQKQKRATKARKRTLSRREFGRLLLALHADATPQHLRTFTIVAMLTGQRSGAIRSLRWEHVDFEEGKLWFTRANPDAPDNKRVLDHPMTDPLANALREALVSAEAARRRKLLKDGEAPELGFVIEHKFKEVGSLKTAWHALLKRAQIEDVWIHDLRRTAATFARNSGRSNADVALYLNDSEEVTERSYAHASPTLLLPMQETIAEIMDKAKTEAQDP